MSWWRIGSRGRWTRLRWLWRTRLAFPLFSGKRGSAFTETQTVLKVYPQVRLMMAISAPAVPGAAEAVRQAGHKDVNVIGLSLPSICKRYIHDGVVQSIVLWSTRDLGYLTAYAS